MIPVRPTIDKRTDSGHHPPKKTAIKDPKQLQKAPKVVQKLGNHSSHPPSTQVHPPTPRSSNKTQASASIADQGPRNLGTSTTTDDKSVAKEEPEIHSLKARNRSFTAPITIVTIADTYKSSRALNLPPGDVLIHSGNLTENGTKDELYQSLSSLDKIQGYEYVFWVGGSRDKILAEPDVRKNIRKRFPRLNFIRDGTKTITIRNRTIQFYGKSGVRIQPEQRLPEDMTTRGNWGTLTKGVEIVINGSDYDSVGLMQKLHEVKPKLLIHRHPAAPTGVEAKIWNPVRPEFEELDEEEDKERRIRTELAYRAKNVIFVAKAHQKPIVFEI